MQAKELDALLAPLKRPAVADLLGEADLELGSDSGLLDHLGKAVPKDSLIAVGQHGSGSLIALWRQTPTTPLARYPVIWLDSEGDPVEALAPDFAAFLELLPYGLGQLYDLIQRAQRMRDGAPKGSKRAAFDVETTDLREGLVMIAEELGEWIEAGLSPASDPLAIVEKAVALPFAAWWSGLPDA